MGVETHSKVRVHLKFDGFVDVRVPNLIPASRRRQLAAMFATAGVEHLQFVEPDESLVGKEHGYASCFDELTVDLAELEWSSCAGEGPYGQWAVVPKD